METNYICERGGNEIRLFLLDVAEKVLKRREIVKKREGRNEEYDEG